MYGRPPHAGHIPTDAENALLAGVGLDVVVADRAVVIGELVWSDASIERHVSLEVIYKGECLARSLSQMLYKQAFTLSPTGAIMQKTTCLERGVDASAHIYF